MKNIVTILAFAIIIFTAACKKDAATTPVDTTKTDTTKTTTKTTTTNSTNSWKLGSTSFNTVYTTRTHSSIGSNNAAVTGVTFMDSTPGTVAITNSVVLFFLTPPTTSGTYRVVAYPSNLTATQVAVSASYNFAPYSSTGAGAVDIAVTATNGKITAVIPELPTRALLATTDTMLSGTVTEK